MYYFSFYSLASQKVGKLNKVCEKPYRECFRKWKV